MIFCDLFPDNFDPEFEEENATNSLRALKSHWMNNVLEQEGKHQHQCLFISATKKQNIEEFREVVYGTVKQLHAKRYPYNNFLY